MSIRLSAALEAYLKRVYVRPDTERAYREKCGSLIRFAGDPRLEEITPELISDWRDFYLIDQKRSPVTWNTCRRHVAIIFRFAIHERYVAVERNPVLAVPPARAPVRSINVVPATTLRLASDELLRLGAAGSRKFRPQWYWRTVLLTLSKTGMRRRQLVELRAADINLRRGVLRLQADSSKSAREYDIPIHAALYGPLQELLREAYRRTGLPPQRLYPFNLHIYHYPGRGRRYQPTQAMPAGTVTNFFARLGRHIGRRIGAHRLRHTVATELANRDTNLKRVADLLGHSSVQVTERYVHPDIDAMRAIIADL